MPTTYKRMSRAELLARGYSAGSERYLGSDGTDISKRQYQKIQRGGLTYTAFRKQREASKPRKEPTIKRSRGKHLAHGIFKSEYKDLTLEQTIRLMKRHKTKRVQLIGSVPAALSADGRYKETSSGMTYHTFLPLTDVPYALKLIADEYHMFVTKYSAEKEEILIDAVFYTRAR